MDSFREPAPALNTRLPEVYVWVGNKMYLDVSGRRFREKSMFSGFKSAHDTSENLHTQYAFCVLSKECVHHRT